MTWFVLLASVLVAIVGAYFHKRRLQRSRPAMQTARAVPPWTTWMQTDLPSQFTSDHAHENAAFLATIFGAQWLSNAPTPVQSSAHPILRAWHNNGANSFFELNALAEDLRQIQSVPGFDIIIHDLRRGNSCLAAWHVAHVSAMLARGENCRLIEFLDQDEATKPDFLLEIEGEAIAVEAKRFYPSKEQSEFEAYGRDLLETVLARVIPETGISPLVFIVVKNPKRRPDTEPVCNAVGKALSRYSGSPVLVQSAEFNVIVEEMNPPPTGLSSYRGCFVVSPRSENENIRVQDRSKRASGQLRPLVDSGHSGLLCLGLNDYQDPQEVTGLLARRFRRGEYSSVAAVTLHKYGVHLAPPERCFFDLIATLRNEKTRVPLRANPVLAPIGRTGKLIQDDVRDTEIPIYRVANISGKVSNPDAVQLPMPGLRSLPPHAFQ